MPGVHRAADCREAQARYAHHLLVRAGPVAPSRGGLGHQHSRRQPRAWGGSVRAPACHGRRAHCAARQAERALSQARRGPPAAAQEWPPGGRAGPPAAPPASPRPLRAARCPSRSAPCPAARRALAGQPRRDAPRWALVGMAVAVLRRPALALQLHHDVCWIRRGPFQLCLWRGKASARRSPREPPKHAKRTARALLSTLFAVIFRSGGKRSMAGAGRAGCAPAARVRCARAPPG